MSKIPRKKKKKIPNGRYCYQPLEFPSLDNGYKYKVKYCSFLKSILTKDKPEHYQNELDKEYPNDIVTWCTLLKHEIDDETKSCDCKLKFKKL